MKKILKRAAAAVSLLLVLMLACSCMDMETGIIFKEDGSARVYCDMTVDEELLEKSGKTKEEFLKSISESSDSDKFESWENREEITKTVSGKTYFGIRYFADKTWDEITSIDNVNDSEIFCEIKNEGGKISVKMVLNGIGETSGGDVAEYIAQGMMNVRFRITAPFELVETNGTKDEDGSVYWDLIPVMTGSVSSLEMTATYNKGGINLVLILCIAGGVVVVAGIIIAVVLLTKKKPAAAPVPMGAILGEQPEQQPAPVQQTVPAQQPAPAEQPAPVTAKFCKDCGAKIEEGSKFCINCGAKQG
ncbi:MAG: LppM family (lipo)protein [Ruminiclostridium sp.]